MNKEVLLKNFSSEKKLVYGEVLVPDVEDSQGDLVSAEEIEKAAHEYLRNFRLVGDTHETLAPAEVVESYIAPVDFTPESGEPIRKGSWVMVVKIQSDELWEEVRKGGYTGFSIGGEAYRDPT